MAVVIDIWIRMGMHALYRYRLAHEQRERDMDTEAGSPSLKNIILRNSMQ